MKILKKNQLALLVISLMLITAGYLNYDASIKADVAEASTEGVGLASIGDAQLVNAEVLDGNEVASSVASDENTENKSKNVLVDNSEETTAQIKTNTNNTNNNYFATSKLERNIMYSQMIERYQKILDSSGGDTDQKMIAQQEINELNKLQNAIMIAENLLTTKGFEENIIFVNRDSISVIIGKTELTQSEIAQIQNIISRELNADVENIHISLK